jgi:AraC family cel operon transcriptional repressor
LPGWFDEAMMKLAGSPELLHGGVPALAKVAGYSREHVNRVARKATGLTATDLINSVRLERAAALLRMSSKSLLDIAGECGLPNVGHFYRLFHRRFGTTPHRYRQHHQALLRGGD